MATIRKFLDLSTAHLTPESRLAMEEGRLFGGAVYPHPEGYGAFVFVPDPDHDDPEYPDPEDLKAIFAWARDDGCDYVLIDSDGPVDERLPCYDEEG